MTDINDVLRELNVLSSKENKNNIDKLMNLMKTDQKINKSFNSETVFALSILFVVLISMTFKKIVESFIKVFKIMQLNNIYAITANEIQRIMNVTLYKLSAALFVIALIISIKTIILKQIRVQVAQGIFTQINILQSKNCYECHKFEYKLSKCSKIHQLINSDLIHFNKHKKMCFNKEKQKETKMRLQYDLFRAKTVHFCIQQTNEQQFATVKINFVIIVKKLFSSKNKNDDKEFYNEKMLIKIRAVRQKINFFVRKIL